MSSSGFQKLQAKGAVAMKSVEELMRPAKSRIEGFEAAVKAAAAVADEHSSPPFGHDDPVAVNYWHLGEAYARKEIAAAIRQLISK